MNILKKLTWTSVRGNRKRTLMTVIGIALSCALIVAVAGMISSAQATLVNYVKETQGDYHALYYGVPKQALPLIEQHAQIKETERIVHAGYAAAKDSANEYKPYFHLLTMSKEAMRRCAFKLTAGRFPENENEILIAGHIRYNGGIALYVDDVLTLEIGTRVNAEGFAMTQHAPFDAERGERIIDTTTRTFTIVGIMERPNMTIEEYEAPGYTIVTVDPGGELTAETENVETDVLATFVSGAAAREYASGILNTIVQTEGMGNIQGMVLNNDLIRMMGGLNEELLLTIGQIALIIILIILVTSVFVIRNSFRISVSEKTRQYGLLASVGATSGQIKRCVLREGLIIGAIGIPLGLLIGVAAVFVLVRILEMIVGGDFYRQDLHFVYSVSPWVFVIAVVLSALTIYLACLVPARQAAKIAPVEAIRGNRDVNLKHDKLKSSKVIRALFGIGGVVASNNLKRSRKKYRTTVVSLVLSITVFIALSFFVEGLKSSVSYVYRELNYNFYVGAGEEETYEKLRDAYGLEDSAWYYISTGTISLETWGSGYAHQVIEPMIEHPEDYGTWGLRKDDLRLQVFLYNRDAFRAFCNDNGIRDIAADRDAVLIDAEVTYHYNETGNVTGATVERYTALEAGDTVTADIWLPYVSRDGEEIEEADIEEAVLSYDFSYLSYMDDDDGEESTEEFEGRNYYVEKEARIVLLNTDRPIGVEEWYTNWPMLIVSEDFLSEGARKQMALGSMYINAPDPDELELYISEQELSKDGLTLTYWSNAVSMASQNRRLILIIEIFLYGFITVITLIGVTNIFNTITTNMMLRSKEFAMLKSVGMTKGQFNRMIALESVLYGTKSLVIGVPAGLILSYVIYGALSNAFDSGYFIPWKSVCIAAVFVFVIVGLTMLYSLGKINRQNIIETIRAEAV